MLRTGPNPFRSSLSFLAVTLAAGLAATDARAAEIEWTGYQAGGPPPHCRFAFPDVGSFFHADNWLNYVPPGESDVAVFGAALDNPCNSSHRPHVVHFGNFCLSGGGLSNPVYVPALHEGHAEVDQMLILGDRWTFDFESTDLSSCSPPAGAYGLVGSCTIRQDLSINGTIYGGGLAVQNGDLTCLGSVLLSGRHGLSNSPDTLAAYADGRIVIGQSVDLGNGGALAASSSGSIAIGNAGLQAGTVQVGSGGLLSGYGTISGRLANLGGLVKPGLKALSVTSFEQNAGGVLELQLGGAYLGNGVLNVTGEARLGGKLRVSLAPGYSPLAGTTFTVVSYGSRTDGVFDLELPSGIQAEYGPCGLALRVGIAPSNTIQFSSANCQVGNNEGAAIITIERSSSSGSASVAFAAVAGSAVANVDFLPVTGRLTFVSGQTTQSFTVPILNNPSTTAGGTVNLMLSSPMGANLGIPSTATLTITRASPLGIVQFTVATYKCYRNSGHMDISVKCTGASRYPVTVDFSAIDNTALGNRDYLIAPGSLVFDTAGIRTFRVSILNPNPISEQLSASLVLSNVNSNAVLGLLNTATLWIVPSDSSVGSPIAGSDCNGNGEPDWYEIRQGLAGDCDNDGDLDGCEIELGAADCNGDGVPDSCQVPAHDCNGNSIPEACDVATGLVKDCNGNGQADTCEIGDGTAYDFDDNGFLDECDIASGKHQDCNQDGIPDEFEVSRDLRYDAETSDTKVRIVMERLLNALPSDVVVDFTQPGIYEAYDQHLPNHVPSSQSVIPAGTRIESYLIHCDRPAGVSDPLRFMERRFAFPADIIGVIIRGQALIASDSTCGTPGTMYESTNAPARGLDLLDDNHHSNTDTIVLSSDRRTITYRGYVPEYMDEMRVICASTRADCNQNEVSDTCDISSGTSTDCNGNGVPDACDLAGGTSSDCNGNGIPDQCDIAAGTSSDCNLNGISDECELASGTGKDCNSNGILDECDVARGTSDDCNRNGAPDECDIAGGSSQDCNQNNRPDECEGQGLVFALDPKRTYLRTEGPQTPRPLTVDLSCMGLETGRCLKLQRLGSFSAGSGQPDTQTGMIGVFSATADLFDADQLVRVPGAIPTHLTCTTPPIDADPARPTDIGEDFCIENTIVAIPPGANFLIIAAMDDNYADNEDPNLDFAVRVTPSREVVISGDTIIADGDSQYEGASIVVRGCTLTVNGKHSFCSLRVEGISAEYPGVLRTSPFGEGTTGKLDLAIINDMYVGQYGSISTDGCGYPGSEGPGAGKGAQSSEGGGGGYGGRGGDGRWTTGTGGTTHGDEDLAHPSQLGSGGGNAWDCHGSEVLTSGGPGGGVLRLTINGVLTVDGRVSANGRDGRIPCWRAGGGSGGSIWIECGSLGGGGVISANGGNGAQAGGESPGGGGGGGRVAVYCGSSAYAGSMQAFGGLGNIAGGAGTVFSKVGSVRGTLAIDNNGLVGEMTEFRDPIKLDSHVIVRGKARLGPGWQQEDFALTVTGNFTVEDTGMIDADGRGHLGSQGPGAGSNGASGTGGGGGYGGAGGDDPTDSSAGLSGGVCYGSLTQPSALGSGGGGYQGGAGGGAIRLTVNGILTVDGRMSADGRQGTYGGGSGGSIWIDCGALAGEGIIAANGGGGLWGHYGSGGGGRVAVYHGGSSFTGALQAFGGTSESSRVPTGGAGTVFIKEGSAGGTLVIDNNGVEGETTEFYGPTTLDSNVVVRGKGRLGPAWQQTSFALTITGDVTVESTGEIYADGRGYPGSQGPGAGKGAYGYEGAGGGYGGGGGDGYGTTGWGGVAYGDAVHPSQMGSGGGNAWHQNATQDLGSGGPGGGVIRLIVQGALTVDGRVSANGRSGQSAHWRGGGGSGGSIWIECGSLAGSGVVCANGGAGPKLQWGDIWSGGGGGGRIAVYHGSGDFAGSMQAFGGLSGSMPGGAGTVFTKAGSSRGTLVIDNNGVGGETTEFYGPTMLDSNVVVRGKGRLGPARKQTDFALTITGDVTVESTGEVYAEGRGYPGSQGPGAGKGARSLNGGGGGYGGRGGDGYWSPGMGGVTYGDADLTHPLQLGSGGGNAWDCYGAEVFTSGGPGGGVLRLTINGVLTVDGRVSANGRDGTVPCARAGGGSGGSIWVECGSLAGGGVISANGGNGGWGYYPEGPGGGGGGGRVAVYCGSSAYAGSMQAFGGLGNIAGGAGTVFSKTGSARGTLVIDNNEVQGATTEFNSPTTLDANVLVQRKGRVAPVLAEAFALTVTGDLTLESTGGFDLDGRGYPGSQGPGAGQGGNGTEAGGGGNGGSGGAGGDGTASGASGGITYGDAMQPQQMGSGGGNAWRQDPETGVITESLNTGGTGGGAVRLTVNGALMLDGQISANGLGGSASTWRAGGGSGGSIWIECGSLAGSGMISANGGVGPKYTWGDYWGGGGGGGRIAVYHGSGGFTGSMQTFGGMSGSMPGGAGTVFTKAGPARGTLVIDNNGVGGETTEFYGPTMLDSNVVVRGKGRLGPARKQTDFALTITGDVTVESTGEVYAEGRGYPGSQGPGAGKGARSLNGGGGGYGGRGGDGYLSPGMGGGTYGDEDLAHPSQLGSGGGNAWDCFGLEALTSGGPGGGVLRLTINGVLTVDGRVSANGREGWRPCWRAGGGSGGSIWIECGSLAGGGVISANGGNGANAGGEDPGGGGGGGRVAVYTCSSRMLPEQLIAEGGLGAQNGAIGTVHMSLTDIVISESPATIYKLVGETATFSVGARSLSGGTIKYQWRKNGTSLVDDPHISGATTDTLTISSIGLAEVASYDVVLTGGCGTGSVTSMAASLMLLSVADLDRDGDVDPGDLATFKTCISGPAIPRFGSPTCQAADLDNDGDVDQDDFGVFQRCFSGNSKPADPGCGK